MDALLFLNLLWQRLPPVVKPTALAANDAYFSRLRFIL
ncbi:hypothetical protein GTCCBUS3UF5_32770 [Geobacillus thermoleovorans CCB_US3_UF5]|uniref:Uncharacterized protein n=2 Tax=Geobacillus thermoleovorans group TaxID=1505648 RepID=U2X2G7_GEOKU|nr:hypothetical protein GTCCBUS3UF5_32770 [Geobacillus thermoleovorans CCB_US3_UF5]GAD12820.1 hypothetical protein GBL_1037 [Geobacillus kaustophilus GBlys]GAJ57672.1 hypothetical protein B23_0862 [Geobacillus thermoleovorans B23]